MFLFSGPEDGEEEESSGFPSDFDTDTVVEFVSHAQEMKEEAKEEAKTEVVDNPESLLLGTVASEIIIISDDEEKEVKIKEEESGDADDEEEEEEEETESESEETMLDKVLHGRRDPEETGRQLMEARARFVNAFMNRRREHERDEAVQEREPSLDLDTGENVVEEKVPDSGFSISIMDTAHVDSENKYTFEIVHSFSVESGWCSHCKVPKVKRKIKASKFVFFFV
ncbi:hypothetical protein RFI_38325 [Reticulomyxa filosa]|uniref:Uncharacterized protein n=1 Tax=Reticulomyxa filosa TaxID=46433 RepID=X6LEH1_RETFI|nr:hypothetical protein RFI_38325 [Reticulomyxa filosa]|eukprot:ETN99154.1 hypothetical protein RFI_38325 [Reticulomyxa filosa]